MIYDGDSGNGIIRCLPGLRRASAATTMNVLTAGR